MAVDVALAIRFGTSAAVDASRIAINVIYLGQGLFISSLFPNIFVPLFAEYRAKGREGEAWRSAISLANLALLPTLVISVLLFKWPGVTVWILAPGLAPAARQWTIFFVRWFGLSLVPLLYAGAAAGVLYSHRIFWTSAAAQLLYNVVLAASILMFGGRVLGPTAIVVGVLVGASAFLLLQGARLAPVICTAQNGLWRRSGMAASGVRKGVRLAIPLFGSPLISQAGGIVAFWSLSAEPVGTIAALGYAGKLLRMASLLPDVMATVLFPSFATVAHAASRDKLRDLSTRSMRMAMFIALPITCTLFTLRVPLIALLLRHGAFSEAAALRVGRLFALFLVGMPAAILSVYLTKILYALEDMWWPTYSNLASVAAAAIAMPPMGARFGAEGVAVVYAGIFWFGALIEVAVLHWKHGALGVRELATFSLGLVAFSAAAAWLGGEAAQLLRCLASPATGEFMLEIMLGGSVSAGVYLLSALLTGAPEAFEFSRYLQWQAVPVLDKMRAAIRG